MITAKPLKWDKKDFTKAYSVHTMIEGAGWKVLAAYWLNQREAIIKDLTDPKKSDRREFYSGALKGFNLACQMAEKVVEEAERQKGAGDARKEIDENFKEE